jgi:hypothetical protein
VSADDLVHQANEALQRGELDDAIALLARSADEHRAAGRDAAASHGDRLAAVVAMTLGEPDRAAALAQQALDAVAGDAGHERLTFAALVTLAEANRHGDHPEAALDHLGEAIALAEGLGADVVPPIEHAALLRRRAGISQALGDESAAIEDLRAATELLAEAGDEGSAATAELELAGVLAGLSAPQARKALSAARGRAASAAAGGVLARIDVADASLALAEGDLDRARACYRSARDGALAAIDPATFIAAVSGMSLAADQAGDRVDAYRSLASGWVTLADLLGRDVAAEAFRPQLEMLRSRWGADEFTRVKATHDQHRLFERETSAPTA